MKKIVLILSVVFLVACNCNNKKCSDQAGVADSTKVSCCDSLKNDSTISTECTEAEMKCCEKDSAERAACCKKQKEECSKKK